MDARVTKLFCSQEGCGLPATLKVSWPGRGWIFYCDDHGQKAVQVLELTGSLGAVAEVA